MNISLRPPVVAGLFYPGSAAELARAVEQMLNSAPQQAALSVKAVIVPHAGYIYSGPVAANLYASLASQRDSVRRIVLLGPSHRVALAGLALPSCQAFSTPLGTVPLDQEAMTRLKTLPHVVVNDAAHAQEHALEVQLPFLQSVFSNFSLVPLVVGQATAEDIAEVLELVWGDAATLIVISSDLSHYLPYEHACEMDTHTARQIVDLKPEITHAQACGATPVNGLLLAARRHQLHGKLIDLRNSGDTAGDRQRVVGYGAFVFSGEEHHGH
jgi:AmmeMemoRadiSam system protein B